MTTKVYLWSSLGWLYHHYKQSVVNPYAGRYEYDWHYGCVWPFWQECTLPFYFFRGRLIPIANASKSRNVCDFTRTTLRAGFIYLGLADNEECTIKKYSQIDWRESFDSLTQSLNEITLINPVDEHL